MLEQLLVLLLVGLGIKTPVLPGTVMGDHTQAPTNISTQSAIRAHTYATQRKQLQENFLQDVKDRRASVAAEYKKEREAFKSKLNTIKDEAKKQKVENISDMLSQINTKRTTAMTAKVNKMDDITARISSGIATLSDGGVDTAPAETAVSTALASIGAAKSAITTQAGKEYFVGITGETKLGDDVSRVRTEFANNLKAAEGLVAQARQAVAAAISVYATLKGELAQ